MNYEKVNKVSKAEYLCIHSEIFRALKTQTFLTGTTVYVSQGYKSATNVTVDKWVYDLIEDCKAVGNVYFFNGIIYVKYKDSPYLFYYDVGLCRKFLKLAKKETKKNGKIKL